MALVAANAQDYGHSVTDALFSLCKTITFDAAHYLPQEDPAHPYGRLHGHSFALDVTIRGKAQPGAEWVEDFDAITQALAELRGLLDHRLLNEVEGLERPTLERLCQWTAARLQSRFPGLSRVTVRRPSLGESCTLELAAS